MTVGRNFRLGLFYCLNICLFLMVFSCGTNGSGATTNSNMGSYQASLVFPPDVVRVDYSDSSLKAIEGGIDCETENIATITCSLYASNNTFLVSDSWPCSQRAGVVNGVAPGSGITVVVTAANSDKVVLFRGEEHDVLIEANQQTVGGEIEMVAADDLDLDGDGYASVSDCDDDDPATYPGAEDTSGNNIDENCDGIDGIVDSFTIDDLGMEFVLIPSGTFMMGSPTDEPGRDDNEVLHQVTLTQYYYIQTTEMTQEQWRNFVYISGSAADIIPDPSHFDECGDNCPVENVSHYNILRFIRIFNEFYSGQFDCRLPTEAEWEYAARAGSEEAFAEGANTETGCVQDSVLDSMGWYCFNSAVDYSTCSNASERGGPDCVGTHPVATKVPNTFGLYDMHGNVWEWCEDVSYDYPATPVRDPANPPVSIQDSSIRVLRGGSYFSPIEQCRSGNRGADDPYETYFNYGFRLVCRPLGN